MSIIVDDDNTTAKELWTELGNIYGQSNTQMVIIIERDIETMTLEKEKEWEMKIEMFEKLTAKLASQDKHIPPEIKVSKILRTLQTRVVPVAMVAELNEVPFGQGYQISERRNTLPKYAWYLQNYPTDCDINF